MKHIATTNPPSAAPGHEFIEPLWAAFGAEGIAALAFWTGALFSGEIRSRRAIYPVLHVSGTVACGKTTLIESMWKLLGRSDYEGFDPFQSTKVALASRIEEAGGLPIVLIPGMPSPNSFFSLEEISHCDRGGYRSSAIVISAREVPGVVRAKAVRIELDPTTFTPKSRHAAMALKRLPSLEDGEFISYVRGVEGLLEQVLASAKAIEKVISAARCRGVRYRVDRYRATTHGLILAWVKHLRQVVPVTEEMINGAEDVLVRSLIH